MPIYYTLRMHGDVPGKPWAPCAVTELHITIPLHNQPISSLTFIQHSRPLAHKITKKIIVSCRVWPMVYISTRVFKFDHVHLHNLNLRQIPYLILDHSNHRVVSIIRTIARILSIRIRVTH